MDNMKEQKDFSIQLKLREIDRTYEEIDKEDKNFKDIALGLFTLMGVIYGFIFTNYNDDNLKNIIDALTIVLTPSLAAGVVLSAVTSIVKQNYMRKYVKEVTDSFNNYLSKKYKIIYFTDWNKENNYGGKKEILYIWNLFIPVTVICFFLIINVILRFIRGNIYNIFKIILMTCFIAIFSITVIISIAMAMKNKKDCNK